MSDTPEQEFIPAEIYERELAAIADDRATGGIVQKELNRRSVVRSILETFDLIGGVPAMAIWARNPDNQGEFYKIYARMAPSPQSDPDPEKNRRILHVLPRTALDE